MTPSKRLVDHGVRSSLRRTIQFMAPVLHFQQHRRHCKLAASKTTQHKETAVVQTTRRQILRILLASAVLLIAQAPAGRPGHAPGTAQGAVHRQQLHVGQRSARHGRRLGRGRWWTEDRSGSTPCGRLHLGEARQGPESHRQDPCGKMGRGGATGAQPASRHRPAVDARVRPAPGCRDQEAGGQDRSSI